MCSFSFSLFQKHINYSFDSGDCIFFDSRTLHQGGKINFDTFKDTLKYDGPEFQLELTINLFRQNLNITEVKIEHKPRIGKSHYTGNFIDSSMVVLKFTKVVILKFFKIE